MKNKPHMRTKYYLGKEYTDIYFTEQEARCMFYFLKGYASKEIGIMMQISKRTVIFYCYNMRKKVHCSSKNELVNLILKTDFLHYLPEIEHHEKKNS